MSTPIGSTADDLQVQSDVVKELLRMRTTAQAHLDELNSKLATTAAIPTLQARIDAINLQLKGLGYVGV